MRADIREHKQLRGQVHDGFAVLLTQARQIWGTDRRHTLYEIVVRLMVGVGDLARLTRDGTRPEADTTPLDEQANGRSELKKELGNILFSTIRWIDDLGLDPMECLDLAITAQEKFAQSGRPR